MNDLTYWNLFDKEIKALMSGTMQYRHTFHYVSTLQKLLQFSLGTFSGSSLSDNEFIAKIINEGSTDLAQYPAAKVQRMAKKLGSSKATAKHIIQHMSNMQGAAQINVLWYNHTSLPIKKKKGSKKPNPSKSTKPQQLQQQRQSNQHQSCDRNPNQYTRCGDSPHAPGFNWLAKKYQCLAKSTNANIAQKLDTSLKCFNKNAHPQPYHKGKPKQANQIIVPEQSTGQYKNTHKCDDDFMIAFQLHAQPQKNVHNQKVTTGYTQKCLYTNIPHRLQPYHKHNKYLCVQLDTCADVNLMPKVYIHFYLTILTHPN